MITSAPTGIYLSTKTIASSACRCSTYATYYLFDQYINFAAPPTAGQNHIQKYIYTCRELNPGYLDGNEICYRYTTGVTNGA